MSFDEHRVAERTRVDTAVDAATTRAPGLAQVLLDERSEPRRASRARELQEQIEQLLPKMRLAVVYGGDKNAEGAVLRKTGNTRSWKSYESVARDIAAALERLGARDVLVAPDDMRLAQRLNDARVDLAWLNSGGVQGVAPCAHAASTLEMMGVPYVGHGPMTAAILDAKHVFKRVMVGAGVPTAPFVTWHPSHGDFDLDADPRGRAAFGGYQGPFIVKPVNGRASLHVEYVPSRRGLREMVETVFEATQNDVMIERYLGGREFCVAMAGPIVSRQGLVSRLDGPFVFCFVERVIEEDERIFTSMDKKPISAKRVRRLDPVQDASVIAKLSDLARRVSRELDLETLVRLDVRADEDGELYVLEANPKPDLKAPQVDGKTSIIAESLHDCGMSYDDLILSLFADRVDLLLSKRAESARHLLAYLRG